ncbi:hypothetical protein ACGF7U_02415 [Micromonospora sp. NPDC047670]|uniref:hypothetical protein n=1 Tax=Micromonospora sp. NPDC047670 TaxID=3364252 RepID=UPI003719C382
MTTVDHEPERQFLDITEGSRGLAKLLHTSLRRLSDGVAGDDLQEMARDILAGHTDLRQIAASDAYGSHLLDRFHHFREWEQSLDPEERERMGVQTAETSGRLDEDQ